MKNNISQEIKSLIKQAMDAAGISYGGEIQLEHPGDETNGDYSTNAAMKLAKELHKNPFEIALEIVKKFPKNEFVEKIEAIKPGFINFWLEKEYLIKEMEKITIEKDNYGLAKQNGIYTGKKYMVEFAHPNTHKMFHIGHLRNATTGETLVRILEANGAKIVRANYEGDVGLHIAKCLYSIINTCHPERSEGSQGDSSPDKIGIRMTISNLENEYKTIKERVEFLGKMYAEGNKAYETEEKAKEEILRINKLIYAKDPEIYELWKKTRQWSLDYFETIYKRLNTHFDRYYFESECFERGKELVLEGVKKGVFKESEGAIVFEGEKFGTHTRVFVTKEGNTTYEGKDMALGEMQFKEHNPDLIIHCVGPEQAEYFKVIFEALGQLFQGMKEKERHVPYGWVKLKEGKMSSRSGNVILGEWLLDEAKERVKKIMNKVEIGRNYEEIASFPAKPDPRNDNILSDIVNKVAVGAVKYSFLKVSLASEIAFDFEESINFEGDSAPYLMYTFARTRSIAQKADNVIARIPIYRETKQSTNNIGIAALHFVGLAMTNLQPEELSLLRWLYRFPEVICEAGENFAPNLICNYLFNLAQKYNLFYNKLPILKTENDIQSFRLMLNEAVGIVLKNGLNLLGIEAVERM